MSQIPNYSNSEYLELVMNHSLLRGSAFSRPDVLGYQNRNDAKWIQRHPSKKCLWIGSSEVNDVLMFINRSQQWEINITQNALQREWGNFPFANWNGICWGLPLQLVQLIKIHFLPHLESFMWERKFEKKFFKKSHIQTPNGVLLIFKLPFPNGSYWNGVCRALWAWTLENIASQKVPCPYFLVSCKI